MHLSKYLFIAVFVCLSCGTENKSDHSISNKIDSLTTKSIETKDSDISFEEELQKETCFITNITEEDGQVFIHANYIQRLDGNAAIEEAKKRGDADTSIIDGKMSIAVVNDYYTINDNPKIRKLALDSSAIFELLYNPDAGKLESNLRGLKKIYKEAIFTLSIKNDRVIKVFEIFVP